MTKLNQRGFSEEDTLTTASKLFEKILDLLPLSGILARRGLKWNKSSEKPSVKQKYISFKDFVLLITHARTRILMYGLSVCVDDEACIYLYRKQISIPISFFLYP